jgi:hypothetical protein
MSASSKFCVYSGMGFATTGRSHVRRSPTEPSFSEYDVESSTLKRPAVEP